LYLLFYEIEQKDAEMAPDIEIVIEADLLFFSWNNDLIQELAEELGIPEIPQPRPCG